MKTYLNSIFFALFILISCGGSKTDVNDSYLSGSVNQDTNLNQGGNNTQGNNSSDQTAISYSFGNDLISVSYTHLTLPTI